MNPSAAQLAGGGRELDAAEVVVLPNNGNVVLTAEQAAGMSAAHIAVVPSTSLPAGLAAMVAFDPTQDAAANARPWRRPAPACAAPRSPSPCATPRSTAWPCVRAQVIGLVDGRAGGQRRRPPRRPSATWCAPSARRGAELITVLTALNGSRRHARADLRATVADARLARTPNSSSRRAASRCTRS